MISNINSTINRFFSITILVAVVFSNVFLFSINASAQADVFIKDTPLDSGGEPNPDTGPMWVTEDIWVRNNPDPGYLPYAFPEAAPPWVPLPHENPEYRDPKFGKPNYVYVRIRNRGSSASTGNERLRLYWAKASTGLSWNTQWVDYLANNCGPTKLYGDEVTKPRKNAATATAAERNAYRDAIIAIGTDPAFVFPDISYWHKQQEVHRFGPSNRHHTAAFLPWHREFVNRYEVLLQEEFPNVKLLYWDWTTDPENSLGFNLFSNTFMGASGRGTGGVAIGAPFDVLAPPNVTRNLNPSVTPPASADSSVLLPLLFPDFAGYASGGIESPPNHDSSHGYIGGGGNMSFINTAAQDPFFFMLHANVDRLWAQWQRNPSNIGRLDPASTYGTDTSNVNITTNMRPWDGTGTGTGLIRPWTVGDGYIVAKTAADPSVVSPPVYDSAPLTIPALQPNEAAVVQIPWYPPNPADFSCFGGDQGHMCLLARIETSTTSPFGMTTLETTNVSSNTRNNNNIAWKNITVVDNFPGALRIASVIVRNPFKEKITAGLRFQAAEGYNDTFFDKGKISVALKPELLKRLNRNSNKNKGLQIAYPDQRGAEIKVLSPEALIHGIELEPGEMHSIDVKFELNRDYKANRGTNPIWDIVQVGSPDDPNEIVGGQRYVIDLSKIALIKRGSKWRYTDGLEGYPARWNSPDFDDSKWKEGKAEFGYGNRNFATFAGIPKDKGSATLYFRHQFDISDIGLIRDPLLRLKADDGAIVYLNGKEIHRVNMPQGPARQDTLAVKGLDGLAQDVFFPVKLSTAQLLEGKNIIAVEIHQARAGDLDMSFDLELTSNNVFDKFEPDVALSSPRFGSLHQHKQPIQLNAEALDTDGKIESVSFYANGKLLGTSNSSPFSLQWRDAPIGTHRIKVVAMDGDKLQKSSEISLSVLKNTPPAVNILSPQHEKGIMPGETVTVSSEASDPGGKVNRVEYYLWKMEKFTDPIKLVGSSKVAPFRAVFKIPEKGHYMITAHAIDNRGLRSLSMPIHIISGGH